jgi:hypothetical protein
MKKCNEMHYCPRTGDRLIHQENRGDKEASSGFNQFINNLPEHLMFWADIDGVGYAKRNHVLRICEHKPLGGYLRPSQLAILPVLALMVNLLKQLGLIHPSSGVFVINADPPYTSGYIRPVLPRFDGKFRHDPDTFLDGDAFKSFLNCDELVWLSWVVVEAQLAAHGQLSADAHEKPAVSAVSAVSAAPRLDLYETFDEYRARAHEEVDPADWEDRIRQNVNRMYET